MLLRRASASKGFPWKLFMNLLVWEKIQHSNKYIADADQNIMKILDEDELFNKFSHITDISKNKMSDWNMNLITTIERWSEVFEFLQSEGISLKNIHIILKFFLAIHGTSASIERVFSITNAQWTDKITVSSLKPARQRQKLIFRTFHATTSIL
jgi:hypothetical protein